MNAAEGNAERAPLDFGSIRRATVARLLMCAGEGQLAAAPSSQLVVNMPCQYVVIGHAPVAS